jgi:glycolate oxidase iron-sulfur subunit
MTIEADNAKEEIKEIVEKCIKCGLCKSHCPVFRIMREEHFSPRGKAIVLDNDGYEKLVFNCTLCKACEVKCPLGIKLCDAFIKARTVLNESKREVLENKEMINNLKKTGNIYGAKEINKE